MKSFSFYQPTRLYFGAGRIREVGEVAAAYGRKAMLVTGPALCRVSPQVVEAARGRLMEAGLEVTIFDRVRPNPTLEDVQKGAGLAREKGVDVIVGLGGGSTMDSARAIAVAATHPGTAMDYLYFSPNQPTEKTLPFVLVPTTSGTGSHMSCCAVITDTERSFKSALWNRERLFARASIVDPELMVTLPSGVTASSGFDVFTHCFESFININSQPCVDLIAVEAMRIVFEALPQVLRFPADVELRGRMAWADTIAGISIANVGTTLPHAMGQPISGHFPQVSHGQSLAVIYPAFLEYTWKASVQKFALVARLLDPSLASASDEAAASSLEKLIEGFLEKIGMSFKLDDFNITREDIEPVLSHCMEFPDVNVNPIVPDTDTVRSLYLKSFRQ